MTARVGSLSTRIARLESSLLPPAIECETCGYPVNQCPMRIIATDDPSPLPTCPECDRLLHPKTRQPFGHCFTRVCLGDPDERARP
ncbi:MAG: hypothetical protein KJZ69_09575 [Phycisphaerales bacterium]|nr:hypothetical protein [Phycisphaerales bacterium]